MPALAHLGADVVLLLHVGFVAFVVFGLVLILIGGVRGWSWVRNPSFRTAHVLAIGVVVIQAWLGMECPLTTLEMWLRSEASETRYPGSFIAYWLHELLYIQAPPIAFTVAYSIFGGLVILSWWWVRPNLRRTQLEAESP